MNLGEGTLCLPQPVARVGATRALNPLTFSARNWEGLGQLNGSFLGWLADRE